MAHAVRPPCFRHMKTVSTNKHSYQLPVNNNEREYSCFCFSFYVFCLCFPLRFPSFIFFSTMWNNFIEAVWQVKCNQVLFTYKLGKIQSNSQPNLKWRRQRTQEAGNAIKEKPAGQSRKVDNMTEQAAEQLHQGCRASRESRRNQIHDVWWRQTQEWTINNPCLCWDEVMQMHFHNVWRAVRCCTSYISDTEVDPISLQTESKHRAGHELETFVWSCLFEEKWIFMFSGKLVFIIHRCMKKNIIAATPSYTNTHSHLQMNTEAFRHIDKQLLPTGNYWGGKGC